MSDLLPPEGIYVQHPAVNDASEIKWDAVQEPTQGDTLISRMLQTEALTTAIMEKRGERMLALTLENQSLRHLLASLEWSSSITIGSGDVLACCPTCHGLYGEHRENCALVAAIAGKGAA